MEGIGVCRLQLGEFGFVLRGSLGDGRLDVPQLGVVVADRRHVQALGVLIDRTAVAPVDLLCGDAEQWRRVGVVLEIGAGGGVEFAVHGVPIGSHAGEIAEHRGVHRHPAPDPVGVVCGAGERVGAQCVGQPCDSLHRVTTQCVAPRIALADDPEGVAQRRVEVAVPGVLVLDRVGAVEHQGADPIGMAHGESLRHEAAVGVPVHVNRVDAERIEHLDHVVDGEGGAVEVRGGTELGAAEPDVGARSRPRTTGVRDSRSLRTVRCPGCR